MLWRDRSCCLTILNIYVDFTIPIVFHYNYTFLKKNVVVIINYPDRKINKKYVYDTVSALEKCYAEWRCFYLYQQNKCCRHYLPLIKNKMTEEKYANL